MLMVCRNANDDFTFDAATFRNGERRCKIFEGENLRRGHTKVSPVDLRGDRLQISRFRSRHRKHVFVPPHRIGDRIADYRRRAWRKIDVEPAFLQHVLRGSECEPSAQFEDGAELAASIRMPALVVDDIMGPELSRERSAGGATDPGDNRSCFSGELQREQPNPARAAIHQNAIASLYVDDVTQRLKRRDRHCRHARGDRMIERRRFVCDCARVHQDAFRNGAVAHASGSAIDSVAYRETSNFLAERLDDPAKVKPGGLGKMATRDDFELSATHFSVDWIDRRGDGADEHVAAPRRTWLSDFLEAQDLASSVRRVDDSLHSKSLEARKAVFKFPFRSVMLHVMKLTTLDWNQIKALHHLLEEAHVGRAAVHLGITPAAASNALRRLREGFRDPLLVKEGRGLVRTRVGQRLRREAREVLGSVQRLLVAAQPFDPAVFEGQLTIAMSDHVAACVLPELDRVVRAEAPRSILAISLVPLAVSDWLVQTAGVLIAPAGAFAASDPGDALVREPFYDDDYICAMRAGHPVERQRWDAETYAAHDHVLVVPRGRTQRSDVDEQLSALGFSRRIVRVVPSFSLALPLVANSDLIASIPSRYAGQTSPSGLLFRAPPIALRPLKMEMIVHPAHADDASVIFMKKILRNAFANLDRRSGNAQLRPPAART